MNADLDRAISEAQSAAADPGRESALREAGYDPAQAVRAGEERALRIFALLSGQAPMRPMTRAVAVRAPQLPLQLLADIWLHGLLAGTYLRPRQTKSPALAYEQLGAAARAMDEEGWPALHRMGLPERELLSRAERIAGERVAPLAACAPELGAEAGAAEALSVMWLDGFTFACLLAER